MKKTGIALAVVALIVALSACQGPVGPAGSTGSTGTAGTNGTNGIPGPSLYLVDASNNRYYSGSSINLGWSYSTLGQGTVSSKTLSLVNKTGGIISFAGPAAAKVETVDGTFSCTYPPTTHVVYAAGSAADGTVASGGVPEISVATQIPSGTSTVPAGSSVSFTLQFVANSTTRTAFTGEYTKDYRIQIQDPDSSVDDFSFEVYGIASC